MTNDPFQNNDLFGEAVAQPSRGALADRFMMPPFSVLNAREGEWQNRKREWLSLGIESEVGRDKALLARGGDGNSAEQAAKLAERYGRSEEALADGGIGVYSSGTSVFDPVVCELAYRWFCPAGGQVIDPFCGGSVRGIVAAKLGFKYWGCDLRQEQVTANEEQGRKILGEAVAQPEWVCGDARNELAQQPPCRVCGKDKCEHPPATDDAPFGADFIFTCPPYFDLEIYSEQPEDLSNMTWSHFCTAYHDIIEKAGRRLKNNRFACFVVGDIRDQRTGAYRNLPGVTIAAFMSAGFTLHNECILVTSVGSLPIRAAAAFEAARKLGKTHQNILVFCKGEPEKAAAAMRLRAQ